MNLGGKIMSFRSQLVVAAICFLAINAVRAEEENPYKKAKVGDWVEYSMKSKVGGNDMEMSTKQTVTNKTDKEVTVEVVTNMMGQTMKNQFTVDLTKKFDPYTTGMKDAKVEVKELEKGEENVTVGGKSLKTNWVRFETTGQANGMAINAKGKAWSSPEVPLNGLVKSETEMMGMKQVMELKGYGSGK
jgi:hypothetical protein